MRALLTKREARTVLRVACGKSYEQIAREDSVSMHAVRARLKNVKKKVFGDPNIPTIRAFMEVG